MIDATLHISYPRWWQALVFRFRKRYDISIPTAWEEVPPRQVLPVMKTMMKGYAPRRLFLQVLKDILPLPSALFYRIQSVDFVERLIPHIEWMASKPMTATPLRAIAYQGKVYAMPGPDFENIRLGEYKEADKYYQQMLNGDNTALPMFLAVLLREMEPSQELRLKNGDLRQPFYSGAVPARAEIFEGLPAEVGFYVLQYFTSCKASLHEQYLAAFDSGKSSEHSDASWNDALTDVAENGTFGNYEQVLQLQVHVFYEWIAKNKRRIREQELKELQDAIKNNHSKFAKA